MDEVTTSPAAFALVSRSTFVRDVLPTALSDRGVEVDAVGASLDEVTDANGRPPRACVYIPMRDERTPQRGAVIAFDVFTPLTQIAVELSRPGGPTASGAPQDLSPRELDILDQLAAGATDAEAAQALGISVHTVGTHRRRLYAKLRARSRAHAIAIARARTT